MYTVDELESLMQLLLYSLSQGRVSDMYVPSKNILMDGPLHFLCAETILKALPITIREEVCLTPFCIEYDNPKLNCVQSGYAMGGRGHIACEQSKRNLDSWDDDEERPRSLWDYDFSCKLHGDYKNAVDSWDYDPLIFGSSDDNEGQDNGEYYKERPEELYLLPMNHLLDNDEDDEPPGLAPVGWPFSAPASDATERRMAMVD